MSELCLSDGLAALHRVFAPMAERGLSFDAASTRTFVEGLECLHRQARKLESECARLTWNAAALKDTALIFNAALAGVEDELRASQRAATMGQARLDSLKARDLGPNVTLLRPAHTDEKDVLAALRALAQSLGAHDIAAALEEAQ